MGTLPKYLSNIKSSGIYRFIWDKSILTTEDAMETMRLLPGYSEKGPFNTPVYLDNISDFEKYFGKGSKWLERKGVFFHRLCKQALQNGPIYALNLKPFDSETVDYIAGTFADVDTIHTTANIVEIYDTNRFWKLDYDILPEKINTGSSYFYLTATDSVNASCTVIIRKADVTGYDITIHDWYANYSDTEMPLYLEPIMDENLSEFWVDIYVFRGDLLSMSDTENLSMYFDEDGNLVETVKNAFGEDVDTLEVLADDTNSGFLVSYTGCTIPYFKDGNNNYVSIDLLFNEDWSTHKMLMKLNEEYLDTLDDSSSDSSSDLISTLVYGGVISSDSSSDWTSVYLSGYDYTTISRKSDAVTIQEKCYGVLDSDKGMITALTNRTDIEYHYIVDTFASYVSSSIQSDIQICKARLAELAKKKDNAFVIANFPAMKEFIDTENYMDDNNKFDISLIPEMPKYFRLPKESEGASYIAYYTPVILSDGTVKQVVPSAALVSNRYMDKYSTFFPYDIVAGPNRGLITIDGLQGPDYNYCRADLDVLEPMGVNVIIYQLRKGTLINGNMTAKQNPISSLSKAHVRELVIFIQDEMELMLQNYQWEFNNQELRDTVAEKAITILETIQNNGGIYAFTVQCDENNNTDTIIDNSFLIVDLSIEPAKGSEKIVQNLTLYKKGGLTSTVS